MIGVVYVELQRKKNTKDKTLKPIHDDRTFHSLLWSQCHRIPFEIKQRYISKWNFQTLFIEIQRTNGDHSMGTEYGKEKHWRKYATNHSEPIDILVSLI